MLSQKQRTRMRKLIIKGKNRCAVHWLKWSKELRGRGIIGDGGKDKS